jgi:ribonuclease P protein component
MKRKTIRNHLDFVCPRNTIAAHCSFCVVKAKPVRANVDARYGLVASKRIFRLATQRNRAKRLMRDWIAYSEDFMSPQYDYIFILNSKILETVRKKGRNKTKNCLKKINKISKQNEK